MSTQNSSNLTNIDKADENYNMGLQYLQTSCINCRFFPSYLDAIHFFKKAADAYHNSDQFEKEIAAREKIAKCLNNSNCYWEEGNEHEKMFKIQLHQLKLPIDAQNSMINSFHAYAANRSYDDGIKALMKSSNEFINNEYKEEAEKILEFAFMGIDKYYQIIISNKDCDYHCVYDCVDKYLDFLFSEEKYDKSAEISQRFAELIIKENKNEKRNICKYIGFQAVAELLGEKEDNFQKTIQKGKEFEEKGDDFCSNIYRLVNIVRQNSKENEKIIKRLYDSVSRKMPPSLGKIFNIKFIKKTRK